MMNKHVSIALAILLSSSQLFAQAKPEDTEVWTPEPPKVTPGKVVSDPPSDAIILFDGKNENEWVLAKDTTMAADWTIEHDILTVNKASGNGNIQTRRSFTNYQL